jgi:predicted nucleic acid-binding protein
VILVDTSVWVDHLRRGEPHLVSLLEAGQVLMHPFVLGEVACGSLAQRKAVLALLQQLPAVTVADPDEALGFIDSKALHGQGIGYVDVHLLAAAALTPQAKLWTRDKRLATAAADLGLAFLEGGAH